MADPYIGEIRAFAGNYAPEGWSLCDGQALEIRQYQALYSLIGTMWGGDGISTFNLPDLRGRLAIGSGQGPGLTPRGVGKSGGHETVSLTEAHLPAHTHPLRASTQPATTKTPGPGLVFAAATSPTAPGANKGLPYVIDAAGATARTLADDTVGLSDGHALPHPNLMPGFAITYIIALTGEYPVSD